MRVLITGVQGYIGTPLSALLLKRGHEVVGVDTGYYANGRLYGDEVAVPAYIRQDVRRITEEDLNGFEAVIHLAELSNDPLSHLDRRVTYEINYRGSVALAQRCKAAGVARFIYSSSCSVYGAGADGYRTEESELCPLTAYAECKVLVERDVARLAADDFSPVFLRNATAFGASPRMRFDLVLNNLAGLAWTTGEIVMVSDGQPWRPIVHVSDICEAMACALEAPREVIHNEVFNVGDTKQNYRVREIAEIVAAVFPGCGMKFGSSEGDNRSYRVAFDKISARLSSFRCRNDAHAGATELMHLFNRIALSREVFEFPAFTRVRQLEHLIRSGQLDRDFFWTDERSERPADASGQATRIR